MKDKFLFGAKSSPEWPAPLSALMADFTDRRGLGQMWDSLDDGVREEMMTRWEEIIATSPSSSVAVDEIVVDLSRRSGFDHVWDSIDGDIQDEIKQEWVGLLDGAR